MEITSLALDAPSAKIFPSPASNPTSVVGTLPDKLVKSVAETVVVIEGTATVSSVMIDVNALMSRILREDVRDETFFINQNSFLILIFQAK